MSMWDVIIIAVVCLAIFRGYFKGLCRRLSDWVGLVIAFVASTLSVSHIDGFVSGTLGVDGRSKIGEWLESYFASRVSANPDNQLESLKQWVGNLFLPDTLKENLYGAIDDSASEIYVSIYNQVARVLADPIWHVVLLILGTIVFFALCILVGEICGGLVRRFTVTQVIDRFLGAIASGFLVLVVIGLFTSIAVFIVPESAGWFGRALHQSFMGPVLGQAMDALLKGGIFF